MLKLTKFCAEYCSRMNGQFVLTEFLQVAFLTILSFSTTVTSIPIDNSLIGSQIITECWANRSVDLGIILDGSGSVGDTTFELQKKFVNLLIDQIDIAANKTRIGIIQYSGFPRMELSFSASNNMDKISIKRVVGSIQYLSGSTNTGEALKFALDRLFIEARGGGIPKIGIVVTDGQSQDRVVIPSEALRQNDILMYAVGVTNLIDVNELIIIAGSPKRVFTVETFEQLNRILVAKITDEMCRTDFQRGYPEIICGSDRIGVRARTKNVFKGNVFIKNHFHNPSCRLGAESFLSKPTEVGISVPFTECDIKRYRSLNPRGVYVETTVIFMFHEFFLTKVDQAIKVQCFYMEADKTVDVPLEVSMLTTEFRTETYPMPTCYYTLHRGSPDGPLVRFAVVGEAVYHRWECVEHDMKYDTYGMLVHSCFVDDSHGNFVFLIDEDGCGIDVHLLGTPEYAPSLRVAFRESHIFKYADRPLLQFQCQITICYKHDGACEGITPPKCENSRRKPRSTNSVNVQNILDVLSESVTVLDVDTKPGGLGDLIEKAKKDSSESSQNNEVSTCFSQATVAVLVAGTSVFVSFSVVLAVSIYFGRKSDTK